MDDEEAEAILRALGGLLEWQEISTKEWFGHKDGVGYHVFTGDTGRTIAWQGNHELQGDPYYRNKDTGRLITGTPSQLKAACERHHATGKWE